MPLPLAGIPLGVLGRRWFAEHFRALAPLSQRHHEAILRLGLMDSPLVELPPDEITAADVDEWLDAIELARGPAARNHTRNQCRQILAWAQRQGLWHGRSVFDGARLAVVPNRRDPLLPEHACEVVRYCDDVLERPGRGYALSDVQAVAILLLIFTGLRVHEVLALCWSHYDAIAGHLTLVVHKTARRRGARTLVLGMRARCLLDHVRALRWSDEWVLPSKRSDSGHIEDIWRAWDRLRAVVGTKVRLHDVRHGFAESLYEAEVDLKTIQALLGHTSITTTVRYVGTPRPKKLQAATDRGIAVFEGRAANG